MIWIVLFGFYVRLFERVLVDSAFVHIWNGGWLTILNMTTIGYGEIYPVTHLGRLCVIVSCIIGVFLLSLFVVALSNTVELDKIENECHDLICKEIFRERTLSKHAATVIQMFWRLRQARRKKRYPRDRIPLLYKYGKRKIKFQ